MEYPKIENEILQPLSYHVDTKIHSNGDIEQLLTEKADSPFERVTRWIVQTRDIQVKEALEKLGFVKNEWLPIDTAPKDGSDFLAVTDYGQFCVMKWNGEAFVRSITCRRCDGMGLGSLTHWGKLPTPPNNGLQKTPKDGDDN